MINVQRSECPNILESNDENIKRYNKGIVVTTLWEMQNGKCCYCENLIPENGHSKAVEHFRPKSTFVSLTNDWNNLLLACSQCNGKKSNDFAVLLTNNENEVKIVFINTPSTGESAILDPSDLTYNPEEHLKYHLDNSNLDEWGLISPKNNSIKGETTINTIGLSGVFYTKKHRRLLDSLVSFYMNLLQSLDSDQNLKVDSLKAKFSILMSSKSEMSALVREFVRDRRIDINFNIQIPVGSAE